MEYRQLGRTGLLVSEIGMGCEGFVDKPYEQVKELVDAMEAGGVNCIDLYTPNPEFRSNLGWPCGAGGKNLSSRPTSAPSGRTDSTSAPGTWRRYGRALTTSSGGWGRTIQRSA